MIEQFNSFSLMWWNWMGKMSRQVSLLIILISGIQVDFFDVFVCGCFFNEPTD
jgi:hypothetical protein